MSTTSTTSPPSPTNFKLTLPPKIYLLPISIPCTTKSSTPSNPCLQACLTKTTISFTPTTATLQTTPLPDFKCPPCPPQIDFEYTEKYQAYTLFTPKNAASISDVLMLIYTQTNGDIAFSEFHFENGAQVECSVLFTVGETGATGIADVEEYVDRNSWVIGGVISGLIVFFFFVAFFLVDFEKRKKKRMEENGKVGGSVEVGDEGVGRVKRISRPVLQREYWDIDQQEQQQQANLPTRLHSDYSNGLSSPSSLSHFRNSLVKPESPSMRKKRTHLFEIENDINRENQSRVKDEMLVNVRQNDHLGGQERYRTEPVHFDTDTVDYRPSFDRNSYAFSDDVKQKIFKYDRDDNSEVMRYSEDEVSSLSRIVKDLEDIDTSDVESFEYSAGNIEMRDSPRWIRGGVSRTKSKNSPLSQVDL